MEEAKNKDRECDDTIGRHDELGTKEKFRKPSAGGVSKNPSEIKGVCPRCEPGEVFVFFSGQVIVQTEIMKNRRQKEARAAKTRARSGSRQQPYKVVRCKIQIIVLRCVVYSGKEEAKPEPR
jgi:hypothetical protein